MNNLRKFFNPLAAILVACGILGATITPAAAQTTAREWVTEPFRFISGVNGFGTGGLSGIVKRDDFRIKIVNPNSYTAFVTVKCYTSAGNNPLPGLNQTIFMPKYSSRTYDSFSSLDRASCNICKGIAGLWCSVKSNNASIAAFAAHTGLYSTNQGQGASVWREPGLTGDAIELPNELVVMPVR